MPREQRRINFFQRIPNFLDTLDQIVCRFARLRKYDRNNRYGCTYFKCTGTAKVLLLAGNVVPQQLLSILCLHGYAARHRHDKFDTHPIRRTLPIVSRLPYLSTEYNLPIDAARAALPQYS